MNCTPFTEIYNYRLQRPHCDCPALIKLVQLSSVRRDPTNL